MNRSSTVRVASLAAAAMVTIAGAQALDAQTVQKPRPQAPAPVVSSQRAPLNTAQITQLRKQFESLYTLNSPQRQAAVQTLLTSARTDSVLKREWILFLLSERGFATSLPENRKSEMVWTVSDLDAQLKRVLEIGKGEVNQTLLLDLFVSESPAVATQALIIFQDQFKTPDQPSVLKVFLPHLIAALTREDTHEAAAQILRTAYATHETEQRTILWAVLGASIFAEGRKDLEALARLDEALFQMFDQGPLLKTFESHLFLQTDYELQVIRTLLRRPTAPIGVISSEIELMLLRMFSSAPGRDLVVQLLPRLPLTSSIRKTEWLEDLLQYEEAREGFGLPVESAVVDAIQALASDERTLVQLVSDLTLQAPMPYIAKRVKLVARQFQNHPDWSLPNDFSLDSGPLYWLLEEDDLKDDVLAILKTLMSQNARFAQQVQTRLETIRTQESGHAQERDEQKTIAFDVGSTLTSPSGNETNEDYTRRRRMDILDAPPIALWDQLLANEQDPERLLKLLRAFLSTPFLTMYSPSAPAQIRVLTLLENPKTAGPAALFLSRWPSANALTSQKALETILAARGSIPAEYVLDRSEQFKDLFGEKSSLERLVQLLRSGRSEYAMGALRELAKRVREGAVLSPYKDQFRHTTRLSTTFLFDAELSRDAADVLRALGWTEAEIATARGRRNELGMQGTSVYAFSKEGLYEDLLYQFAGTEPLICVAVDTQQQTVRREALRLLELSKDSIPKAVYDRPDFFAMLAKALENPALRADAQRLFERLDDPGQWAVRELTNQAPPDTNKNPRIRLWLIIEKTLDRQILNTALAQLAEGVSDAQIDQLNASRLAALLRTAEAGEADAIKLLAAIPKQSDEIELALTSGLVDLFSRTRSPAAHRLLRQRANALPAFQKQGIHPRLLKAADTAAQTEPSAHSESIFLLTQRSKAWGILGVFSLVFVEEVAHLLSAYGLHQGLQEIRIQWGGLYLGAVNVQKAGSSRSILTALSGIVVSAIAGFILVFAGWNNGPIGIFLTGVGVLTLVRVTADLLLLKGRPTHELWPAFAAFQKWFIQRERELYTPPLSTDVRLRSKILTIVQGTYFLMRLIMLRRRVNVPMHFLNSTVASDVINRVTVDFIGRFDGTNPVDQVTSILNPIREMVRNGDLSSSEGALLLEWVAVEFFEPHGFVVRPKPGRNLTDGSDVLNMDIYATSHEETQSSDEGPVVVLRGDHLNRPQGRHFSPMGFSLHLGQAVVFDPVQIGNSVYGFFEPAGKKGLLAQLSGSSAILSSITNFFDRKKNNRTQAAKVLADQAVRRIGLSNQGALVEAVGKLVKAHEVEHRRRSRKIDMARSFDFASLLDEEIAELSSFCQYPDAGLFRLLSWAALDGPIAWAVLARLTGVSVWFPSLILKRLERLIEADRSVLIHRAEHAYAQVEKEWRRFYRNNLKDPAASSTPAVVKAVA